MKNLILAVALSLIMVGGGSGCATLFDTSEVLSIRPLQEVDACHKDVGTAIGMGLLEHPGQDYIDQYWAFSMAMNVSYAYGDRADYEYYTEFLIAMCEDQLKLIAQPDKPKAEPMGQIL